MSSDNLLRQEVRESLGDVRRRIRGFTGLYSDENLIREVLSACYEVAAGCRDDARMQNVMQIVTDRCRRLAYVTNRFADRDPVVISAVRAQAIAAVDLLQDAVFEARKSHLPAPRLGGLLRRRSL